MSAVTPVPILDLAAQYAVLQTELEAAVLDVLRSGGYILGPRVAAFEAAMAEYLGVDHTIGVANGTDALYLALRALDIGPGDEVITTAMSYIATSEAIVRAGAIPVFVDIDAAGTYNLSVEAIEAAITSRTRALLPVHIYGQPVDMDALMSVARRHGLHVIEDCAQAIGAEWNGQKVGSFGELGCFSFFPSKNLGAAGDGGLISTQNTHLAEKCKRLRVHGASTQYDHAHEGMNSRLDALQAAILQVKLPHIDTWNEARRAVAQRYSDALRNVDGLTVPVVLPPAQAVFHQYTIAVPALVRDSLVQALADEGVMARIYYPIPLHLQGMHRNLGYVAGSLPRVEAAAQQVLSLPMYPELPEASQQRVIDAIATHLPRLLNQQLIRSM